MSELEKRNAEAADSKMAEEQNQIQDGTAPVADEAQPQAEENAEKWDDRENAPRGARPAPTEKKKKSAKKGKKKRRKSGMALSMVAILLAVALLFGVVVGYAVGRSTASSKVEELEGRLSALQAEEEAFEGEQLDVFQEELTGENQAALNDLSGEGEGQENEANALMGEDSLLGGEDTSSAEDTVVVAEFEGGQLTRGEVARAYEEQMTSYLFAGYSEEEISASLLNEVMRAMVSDRVLEAHAKEMGLYELTDEDQSQIQAEAEARYQEQLDFSRGAVDTQGMTEEEATGALKAYLQEAEGITLESIQEEIEKDWWTNKVYEAITEEITLSDEELQEAYDALLQEQTNSYQTYPDDFEFAQMNGETIVFNLPGYRAVRTLTFRMSMEESDAVYGLVEQIKALDAQTQAEEIAQLQAQIDACYADAQQRAEEALKQLEGGADFETLLETVGEDEGMKDAKLKETGYYIGETSQLWPQSVVDAAKAFTEPGQISEILRTEDGVCILQYVGEVPQGAVALEDVKPYLAQETLEDAKNREYERQLDAWVQEANPQYYPERMQ